MANARDSAWFHADEMRAVEKAIRRIVRANDLQSKALVKSVGVTAPQLAVLNAIAALGEVTTTALSAHAEISPATVITILDNLEDRGIIQRYRSMSDRRIVHTRLTEKGQALVAAAPEPLSETFKARFAQLGEARRRQIVKAVQELADMLARDRVPAPAPEETRPVGMPPPGHWPDAGRA